MDLLPRAQLGTDHPRQGVEPTLGFYGPLEPWVAKTWRPGAVESRQNLQAIVKKEIPEGKALMDLTPLRLGFDPTNDLFGRL